jgi:pimeloyl-ACP methyl ester carboxylesterase
MAKMSIRGISLNVEVIGKGYPLVLMHGGPGLDYKTLLALKPLENQFTLVFYDHRCNGHSEGADVTTMTMDNLTADADALRQALGFEKWVVLGHSFGGNVALEYALRYPQSLSHLILMDTGGDQWWVNHNAMDILAQRGFSPSTVQDARRFYNGQITPREFITIFLKINKAYSYSNSFDLWTMIQGLVLGYMPKMRPDACIFGYSKVLQGWSVMDRLGEIKVPTLVIAGSYDFLFPPEHQKQLASGIPNSRLVLVDRAGHNPDMEQPAETINAIRDFILSTTSSSAKQTIDGKPVHQK